MFQSEKSPRHLRGEGSRQRAFPRAGQVRRRQVGGRFSRGRMAEWPIVQTHHQVHTHTTKKTHTQHPHTTKSIAHPTDTTQPTDRTHTTKGHTHNCPTAPHTHIRPTVPHSVPNDTLTQLQQPHKCPSAAARWSEPGRMADSLQTRPNSPTSSVHGSGAQRTPDSFTTADEPP